MTTMTQAILAALHLLAFDGECTESAGYPTPSADEITGYVVIEACAIPTTAAMTERLTFDTYLDLAGD